MVVLFVPSAWWVARQSLKERWKLVWHGRVTQGLDFFKKRHPQKRIIPIAIKGGKQCDWELSQFSHGGAIQMLYPEPPLIVFNDLKELEDFTSTQHPENEEKVETKKKTVEVMQFGLQL